MKRFLFGGGGPPVGLDIGRRAVCAVALQRTATGVALAGVGVAACQPQFDSHGMIANTAQVAAAAAKALSAAGIDRGCGLIVGMPARASAIVACQLPERLPARLRKDAATYAAASALNISPKDVRITSLLDRGGGRWHASVTNPRLEGNREKLVSQMRNGCRIASFDGEPSALHRAMLGARPSLPPATRLRAFLDARTVPGTLIVFDAVDGVWPVEGTSVAQQLLEVLGPSQATRQVVVQVGYRLSDADFELREQANIELCALSDVMPQANEEHRAALTAFGLALYQAKPNDMRRVEAGPFAIVVPAPDLPEPAATVAHLPPVPADLAHLRTQLNLNVPPPTAPPAQAPPPTPAQPAASSSSPLPPLLSDDEPTVESSRADEPADSAEFAAPDLKPLIEEDDEEDVSVVASRIQPPEPCDARLSVNGLAGDYHDEEDRSVRAQVGWTQPFIGDAATSGNERLTLLNDLKAALQSPQEPFVAEALVGGYVSEPNARVRVAMLDLLCALPTTRDEFLRSVAHAPSSAERVHAFLTLIRREDRMAVREGLRDEDESVAVRVAVEVHRHFGAEELEGELSTMTDSQRVALLRARVAELTAATKP